MHHYHIWGFFSLINLFKGESYKIYYLHGDNFHIKYLFLMKKTITIFYFFWTDEGSGYNLFNFWNIIHLKCIWTKSFSFSIHFYMRHLFIYIYFFFIEITSFLSEKFNCLINNNNKIIYYWKRLNFVTIIFKIIFLRLKLK